VLFQQLSFNKPPTAKAVLLAEGERVYVSNTREMESFYGNEEKESERKQWLKPEWNEMS
jgi:hypothetical protein